MIRRLIFILLLAAPSWAAVCTSQGGNGVNWDGAVGNWSCGHIPLATDSVVIAGGNNIVVESGLSTANVTGITFSGTNPTLVVNSGGTLNWQTMTINASGAVLECTSGSTCNFGSNTATSTTVDGHVTNGTFDVDNGATLNFTGSITTGTTGNSNYNGHMICTPNGVTIFQVLQGNNTSADSALMQFHGVSWSSPAVFETVAGQSAGGNCKIQATTSSSVPKLITDFAIFNRCGDATNDCWTFTNQTNPGSMDIENTLFNNFGRLTVTIDSGDSNSTTFLWNGVDFRNPVNATYLLLGTTNTNVPSANRILENLTCDNENYVTPNKAWQVNGSNFIFGQSSLFPSNSAQDIAGMVSFNCTYNGSGINDKHENMFIGIDTGVNAPGTILAPNNLTNSVWQNSIAYEHASNPHLFNSTTAGTSTQNFWQYNLMDGDFWQPGDSGEVCHSGSSWTCSNNININSNGNLENTQNPQSLTMDHNLQWNQSSISAGETASNALELNEAYDNLFQCPLCFADLVTFPASGNCLNYMSGMNQQSAYVTQTNFNEDFNWKFNFPLEGDPHSIASCTRTIGGGVFPFLGIFAIGNGDYRGATAFNNKTSTAGTGTGCPSACELDYSTGGFTSGTTEQNVQVNDVVYNNSNNQWTTVSAVNSNTQAILNAGPISSFTIASGNGFTILKGIWADHTAIGGATNRGLHDVHADARFYALPPISICNWWNSIGGSLTCPTQIAASGATDTNILTIMHTAITINGWDYGSGGSLTGTNCSANCPQRVTPWAHTPTEILKYAAQSFRVYNGAADNAGHVNTDIGPAWLQNYPAAILTSN